LRLNHEKTNEGGFHVNLGVLFEEQKRYKEAKSEYKKAIAILRELKLTKQFDAAKKEFEEAIRIFYEAIKIEPELAEELALAHNNLGASLCESEKYKAAKNEYKAAIRINKKIKKEDSSVYINLGNVYGKLNCIDLAIENFKKAVKANPRFADAHQHLIRAELIKKGVGLSWWDWWQTSDFKKVVGIFCNRSLFTFISRNSVLQGRSFWIFKRTRIFVTTKKLLCTLVPVLNGMMELE
jgi:tetratricopeptide (TPR) repeat protein